MSALPPDSSLNGLDPEVVELVRENEMIHADLLQLRGELVRAKEELARASAQRESDVVAQREYRDLQELHRQQDEEVVRLRDQVEELTEENARFREALERETAAAEQRRDEARRATSEQLGDQLLAEVASVKSRAQTILTHLRRSAVPNGMTRPLLVQHVARELDLQRNLRENAQRLATSGNPGTAAGGGGIGQSPGRGGSNDDDRKVWDAVTQLRSLVGESLLVGLGVADADLRALEEHVGKAPGASTPAAMATTPAAKSSNVYLNFLNK